MAKNVNRIPVKWVRDRAKSAYEKKDECYICGTDKDLELHHTHSITILFDNWVKKHGHKTDTDEDVIAIRDQFIEEHRREIYDAVYTLCNKDHVKLHTVYGAKPALSTADKQALWIDKQKAKLSGANTEISQKEPSVFSQFIIRKPNGMERFTRG